MNTFFITSHAVAAAACWVVVFIGATWAVFSKTVHDTTLERFFLGCAALGALANCWRIVKAGWVTDGGLFFAVSLAGYVLAIIYKKWLGEPVAPPSDKTQPADLNNEPL